MATTIPVTIELNPEQAIQLAHQLLANAQQVQRAVNGGNRDAYCYVRQEALNDNVLRVRIGD